MRFNSCDSAFWKGYVLDIRSRHMLNRCTNLSNKPFPDSISHIEQPPFARRKISFRLSRCRFSAFKSVLLVFRKVSCLLLKDYFLFVEAVPLLLRGNILHGERVLLVCWEVVFQLYRSGISYTEILTFIIFVHVRKDFLTCADIFPYTYGKFSARVRNL